MLINDPRFDKEYDTYYMRKFKEFFLELSNPYQGGSYSGSRARLGGRLQLPNIYSMSAQRAPITGYQSVGSFADRRMVQREYEANYQGDPRLKDYKYGEVEQGLYNLAQKVTTIDELLQAHMRQPSAATQAQLQQHFLTNAGYQRGNDKIIMGVNPQAFYGMHGLNSDPSYKIGIKLGIITTNQRDGRLCDINAQLLEQETMKAAPNINAFKRSLEGWRVAGQAVDTGMQRLATSQGGVQFTKSLDPFQN